jgi:ferredoxin/flavodoxin---NADP+ reductase
MAHSASALPSSAPTRAELLVVGAGPVGLYAGYYAGYRGLETIVVDALPTVGGQMTAFYPESTIYDVPGFPQIRSGDLVRRLLEQARAFPIRFRLGEEVFAIETIHDRLLVSTIPAAGSRDRGGDLRYEVRAVLLAVGIGRLAPQRRAETAIESWDGRGLDYHAADPAKHRGERVLVVGGSARAVDLALALDGIAADTMLIHRRDRLAVDADTRARLGRSGVRFVPFRELIALAGGARVERAVVEDRRDGRREQLAVDTVLPCYGFSADAGPTRRLGVALEADAVVVDTHMESTRPGLFAAGDGATYPGKVRVLAADFGEACTAVNNIAARIIPGTSLFPGYSSHAKGAARRRAQGTAEARSAGDSGSVPTAGGKC